MANELDAIKNLLSKRSHSKKKVRKWRQAKKASLSLSRKFARMNGNVFRHALSRKLIALVHLMAPKLAPSYAGLSLLQVVSSREPGAYITRRIKNDFPSAAVLQYLEGGLTGGSNINRFLTFLKSLKTKRSGPRILTKVTPTDLKRYKEETGGYELPVGTTNGFSFWCKDETELLRRIRLSKYGYDTGCLCLLCNKLASYAPTVPKHEVCSCWDVSDQIPSIADQIETHRQQEALDEAVA